MTAPNTSAPGGTQGADRARYRRWVAWAAAAMAVVWAGVGVAVLLAAERLGVVTIGAWALAYARLLTWSRLRATTTETDVKTVRWVSGILTALLAVLLVSLSGMLYSRLFVPVVLPFLIAEGAISLAVWRVEPDRPRTPVPPA